MTCVANIDFKLACDWTTVGIVGYGVVGQATAMSLAALGFDVVFYDNANWKGGHSLREVLTRSRVVYICVPTPNKPDGGIDLSYVIQALDGITEIMAVFTNFNPVILIKSTVTPGTTEKLQAMYPSLRLGCSPEFLRQDHAIEDAKSPGRVIVGLCDAKNESDVRAITDHFETVVYYTTPTTAELIKMLSNAFLLVKVAYANLIKTLCDTYCGDSDYVYLGLISDTRISPSHLNPAKGKMPADGPCLPKDLLALVSDLTENLSMSKDRASMKQATAFLKLAYDLAVESKSLKA